MPRSVRLMSSAVAAYTCALLSLSPELQGRQPQGRALTIEDYYRIRTVGSATLSPNGRWVAFTIGNRIEHDNGTRTESWMVAADGSAQPRRIVHEGKDVDAPRWRDDNTLQYSVDRQAWRIDPGDPAAAPVQVDTPVPAAGGRGGGRGGRGGSAGLRSPDGSWTAHTVDKPQPKPQASYTSDFEKRHQERFKGAIFDWKDFQRDGAPFPAPNPVSQPAQMLVVVPTAGAETKVLVDLDLRPSGVAWHPGSRLLAFVADSDWRNELKYSRANLWTVSVDGQL